MKLIPKPVEDSLYLEYERLRLIQTPFPSDASWFEKLKCNILFFILKDKIHKEIIKSAVETFKQKEIKNKKKLIRQVNGAIKNEINLDEFAQMFIKEHPIKEEEGVPAVSEYFEMDDAKFLEMMKETK